MKRGIGRAPLLALALVGCVLPITASNDSASDAPDGEGQLAPSAQTTLAGGGKVDVDGAGRVVGRYAQATTAPVGPLHTWPTLSVPPSTTSTTTSTTIPSTEPPSTTEVPTPTVGELNIVDAVSLGGDAPGPWSLEVPITDAASMNDVLLSWASTRRSWFATVEGPAAWAAQEDPAAPSPPTIEAEAAARWDQAVPGGMRLVVRRGQTGAALLTSYLSFYTLPNGQTILGSGLIIPDARREFIDLVRGQVNAGSPDMPEWAIGNWPGALIGSVLHDVQLGVDGSLLATVPAHLVDDGAGSDESVRISAADAQRFLSPAATWLLGGATPAAYSAEPDCEAEQCVALTFDDGPGPETERMLDVLAHANTLATFYMIGLQVDRWPEIAAAVVAAGHEVGNHTWSHARMSTMGADTQRAEVQAAQQRIIDATGATPTLLRPPYGVYNSATSHLGLGVHLWSVDTRDWQHRTPARTVERAFRETRRGSVVLMHDIFPSTTEVVALVIAGLLSDGYRLVTSDQLFGPPSEGTLTYEQSRVEPAE